MFWVVFDWLFDCLFVCLFVCPSSHRKHDYLKCNERVCIERLWQIHNILEMLRITIRIQNTDYDPNHPDLYETFARGLSHDFSYVGHTMYIVIWF